MGNAPPGATGNEAGGCWKMQHTIMKFEKGPLSSEYLIAAMN